MPAVGVIHPAGHRGRGDDTTKAVVGHRRQRRAHDVEDTVEVRLHHAEAATEAVEAAAFSTARRNPRQKPQSIRAPTAFS